MQIDVISNSAELISFSTKTKAGEDEDRVIQCDLKVVFGAKPEFLDDYLAGHNTGAQPSAVFWRTDPTRDDKSQYVRYFGIEKLALAVPDPKSMTYRVKLAVRSDEYTERDVSITGMDMELHGLQVEFQANIALITAKLRWYPPAEDDVAMLALLAQAETLNLAIQANQTDLVAAAQEPPPRPGTDVYPRPDAPPKEEPKGPNEIVRGWADEDEGGFE